MTEEEKLALSTPLDGQGMPFPQTGKGAQTEQTEQPQQTEKSEKSEENRLVTYFVRLFSNYDFRNEQQFLLFAKWLIFGIMILVEVLMALHQIYTFAEVGWWRFIALLVTEVVLAVSVSLKLFAIKSDKVKIIFYTLDAIAACCISFFMGGTYPIIVYMLVLTEIYIGAENSKASVWMLVISIVLYALFYGIRIYLQGLPVPNILVLFRDSLGVIVALTAHFLAVHIALAFYRQFLKLESTLTALDESKKELERAYAVVAEVSALEERQRIAKDIHDTAGHSITTVIMQTDAACRIMESNPAEARSKIVAANLQAKHALEELRDSVHLLSGSTANKTLQDALLGIIHESTDGTGIKIRSEIEDVRVLDAKYRFLCNTLKEGISNGLRHGNATAFWFELKKDGDKIRFLLSDNGTGVETQTLKKGFGLSTMTERAVSLGGEIEFHSETDEGFEIRLTLPTDAKEEI